MTFKAMMNSCGWFRAFDPVTYTVHIIPLNDEKIHDASNKCWCNPNVTDYNEWLHISVDGREAHEEGKPLH